MLESYSLPQIPCISSVQEEDSTEHKSIIANEHKMMLTSTPRQY